MSFDWTDAGEAEVVGSRDESSWSEVREALAIGVNVAVSVAVVVC